ncbi:uncharacterized protein LOC143301313 [Babylonia areolata]|uniref:uncharacterized protein LOC143301313 n=2 Tax=Babylonia areolata TaxID=304850 RepID=UPI003FD49193
MDQSFVKTGVVQTTTRHRRRFDDGGRSGQMVNYAPYTHQAWHQQTSPLELTTTVGRIKVSVYRTDITKLPVDAIVNAANEHLAHGGGVAYAIARAAGFSLESDGNEYIRKFGPLKVTQVVATTGGALPCRKVLHAVGPRWTDYKDKTQCYQHLSDTVYNCFSLASMNGFTSLAVSSISSAIFGVPQQTCSECYLAAVQRFDVEWGHRTSLQHIYFVDVNDTMVFVIQNTFWNFWNTPVTVQHGGSQFASALRDSAPVSESRGWKRRWPEPTSVGPTGPQPTGPQPTRPQPTRPEPTSPDVQPSQLSSHQAGGDQILENHWSRHHPGDSTAVVDCHGIRVLFQCKDDINVSTDAIVLWQFEGHSFEDTLSRKFMSVNSKFSSEFVPNYGMKVHHRGDIDITESDSRMVLLPVVGLYHRDSQQEIHAAAQKVLIEVNQARRRTVAFPGYPYRRHHNSDQELEAFAVALYQAVKNVSTMPVVEITEIYIVHPEEKSIQTLKECFERAVDNTDKAKPDRRQNSRHSTTPVCSVCRNEKQCKTLDTCGHHLCDDCSKQLREPKCPDCGAAWGEIHGDQPKGTMKVKYDKTQQLPGFPPGTFVILYKFPGGKHSEQARQYAGERYRGKEQTAYLPDVPEGRKVLMLLKIAFDRRLLFRLVEIQGSCHSHGRPKYRITLNGIEHKTAKKQAGRYSFPDDGYLNRVQQQLAAVGVFASDLTEQQITGFEFNSFFGMSVEHSGQNI